MPISDELKRMLGRPLGRIPSGLYVLSAVHDGLPHAILVSWVQQAAFDPPLLTVALAKDRSIGPMIRQSGRFALSILSATDSALVKRFARSDSHADPFSGIATAKTPAGLPVPSESLAALECALLSSCDLPADHELLIGQPTWAKVFNDARPFLHVRGSGFHY